MTRAGTAEVAHGLTMADLDRAARSATVAARSRNADIDRRYEIAWSAIAEAVVVADAQPRFQSLVHTGALAIDHELDREPQFRGYRTERRGGGIIPRAAVYWQDVARPGSSPEGGVVERLALTQILDTLSPAAVAALHALAIHDNYLTAAAALGIDPRAFRARIGRARGRFLTLWHEGEDPSAVWRVDRRTAGRRTRRGYESTGRRSVPAHGLARYDRHGCRCPVCAAAKAASRVADAA